MKLATGVRAYGNVKIMAAGREVAEDTGEIQFTDYGISGIPVFQVSRFAVRAMEEGQRVEALVDVAADIKEDDLLSMLKCAVNTRKHQSVSESLSGLFNKKLVMMNVKKENLDKVKKVMPAMTGPTISEVLSKEETVAVQAVIDEDVVFELVNDLRNAGAKDILVVPIERII